MIDLKNSVRSGHNNLIQIRYLFCMDKHANCNIYFFIVTNYNLNIKVILLKKI